MRKKLILSLAGLFIILGTTIKVTIANENNTDSDSKNKGLAYYVANIQEARLTNQECFDKGLNMQNVPACADSLKALQLSFVGGGRIPADKFNNR